ncbi:DUF427 domain-containing protein [Paraburkholderia jirisanensis]
MQKTVKIPGPDHPITVTKSASHVTVVVAGKTIADTRRALALRESTYPETLYIPRQDVDMAQLERTAHATYCPYKGDCSYYSVPAGGERATNAVWTYEAPYDAVREIKDYLAFYPDRVDAIRVEAS